MDAIFKIKASEFNESLFAKIKSLLKGQEGEITITINEAENKLPIKEPLKEYISRIKKADTDIASGKGTVFTMGELEDFIKK